MATIFTLPVLPASRTAVAAPVPPAASTQAMPAKSGWLCSRLAAAWAAMVGSDCVLAGGSTTVMPGNSASALR